ncbi:MULTISPECIES: TolB family protein [Shewanella]|uniref:TolB family protein n=1 Tax=Shewanella TaxID=22 RepID=UPI001EFD707A|nr:MULTISPECIES: hypothetical protein [Shewanella]MCG9745158.1 hypothetical protein [Shewanella sp. Isolate8]MCL2910023.1 hypothetical protein [Shewanella aquimarina]
MPTKKLKSNQYHYFGNILRAGVWLLAGMAAQVGAAGYDIWLYPLAKLEKAPHWRLGEPIKVSDRAGYDNQAAFSFDGKQLVFASDRAGSHNDIYRFDIATGRIDALTHTPEISEYSPQLTAHALTYVAEQGVPHQSIWQQSPSEQASPQRAVASLIPAGYYAKLEGLGTLIWARYAYSLYYEPEGEQADERHFVINNAGRSLHALPSLKQFSYLHKRIDGERVISLFDPHTGSHTPLIDVGQGSEDYAWSSDGWLFNLDGLNLRTWPYGPITKGTPLASWQGVSTLTPPSSHHHQPSRIAISPKGNFIAITWQRKDTDQ